MGRSAPAFRQPDGPPPGRDAAVAALAARQHGVVSVAQLRHLSLGDSAIARRVAAGRLHRVHRGVYAVGHTAMSREGRWLAAVLACGPQAVLSHRSAAALWDVRPTARSAIEVTTPCRGRRGPPGVDLHRVRRLHAADVTRRDAIPTTTVARTLVDLAEVLPPRQLTRAVHEAERLRSLDVTAASAAAQRANGRRNAHLLLPFLTSQAPATRSELEARFLELIEGADLPRPTVNATVEGLEVDFLWPDRRLVVETDGAADHHTRRAFEEDRRRDAALTASGLRVVRVTWRRLHHEPEAVTATLRRLLRP